MTMPETTPEYLQPEVIEVAVHLMPGLQPQAFQHSEKTCQPDGDRRKDDVKGNGESELDTRKLKRFQTKHCHPPRQ